MRNFFGYSNSNCRNICVRFGERLAAQANRQVGIHSHRQRAGAASKQYLGYASLPVPPLAPKADPLFSARQPQPIGGGWPVTFNIRIDVPLTPKAYGSATCASALIFPKRIKAVRNCNPEPSPGCMAFAYALANMTIRTAFHS